MTNTQVILLGLCIPFLATTLGASSVFFLKDKNLTVQKFTLAFSAGIMLAASFLSLINPAISMCEEKNIPAYLPVGIGITLGVVFLMAVDFLLSRKKVKEKNVYLLVTAITMHNIPEGMVVGLSVGIALISPNIVSISSAIALTVGIAIQNIPEGSAVCMPLWAKGYSKGKSFFISVLSGVVEPIGAGLAILLINVIGSILPILLSFSAGTMIFVIVKELIPESQENNKFWGTIVFFIGFLIMLVLDIALG